MSFAQQALRAGAVLAASLPATVLAQAGGQGVEPLEGGYLVKLTLGLLLVLALVLALAWLVRRGGGFLQGGLGGQLRILGGISVGTRERIVLVQVGDEQLLVGITPSRIDTLHVLERPIEVPEGGGAESGAFAARLNEALGRRRGS